MTIVRSEEELKAAMERKEKPIRIEGNYAKELYEKYQEKKKKKKKRGLIAGGAIAVAGLAAIPFTAGTSAAVTATGLTMMGLTVGTVTISLAELAVICGSITTISCFAIYKGAKVKFHIDPKTGVISCEIN